MKKFLIYYNDNYRVKILIRNVKKKFKIKNVISVFIKKIIIYIVLIRRTILIIFVIIKKKLLIILSIFRVNIKNKKIKNLIYYICDQFEYIKRNCTISI